MALPPNDLEAASCRVGGPQRTDLKPGGAVPEGLASQESSCAEIMTLFCR